MADTLTPKRALIEPRMRFEHDRAVVMVYVQDSETPGHQDYCLRIFLTEEDDNPEVFSEDRFSDVMIAGMQAMSWIRQARDDWAQQQIGTLLNRTKV